MELAVLISSTFLIFVIIVSFCTLIYFSAKNGWKGMLVWYGFILIIFLGQARDYVFPNSSEVIIEQKVETK